MPREWIRLVSRRLCVASVGPGRFEAHLFDVAADKARHSRSHFSFAVDDAGCGGWRPGGGPGS